MAKNLVSIIDDDESVRRTTTRLIESFGFRAAAFQLPKTFLALVRTIPRVLLLTYRCLA